MLKNTTHFNLITNKWLFYSMSILLAEYTKSLFSNPAISMQFNFTNMPSQTSTSSNLVDTVGISKYSAAFHLCTLTNLSTKRINKGYQNQSSISLLNKHQIWVTSFKNRWVTRMIIKLKTKRWSIRDSKGHVSRNGTDSADIITPSTN